MPTPTTAAPAAATTGWMHPNNSPLAHWYNGTRVLCGRSIPAGTKVVSSDPQADVKKCLKCSAAVTKLAPEAPGEPSPQPSSNPAELATNLQPRHYVRVTLGGQDVTGGVLMAEGDVAVVILPSGQHQPVPLADCAVTTLPPRADLAPGDLIILPGTTGLWRVTDFEPATSLYTCEWTHDSVITVTGNRDDLQVFQRASLAGMFMDLGISSADLDGTDQPFTHQDPPAPALTADLEPGTLGLHAVPLHQTARSGCNVRSHYDPAAIEELAASLKVEGQIENATGRWNAEGLVEIVAGESRRRAQLLRQDQGEAGLTLLVNVRQLTDAEALSISATENMRRRNMTALEECEAMQRLNDAGRSVEEIQTLFGYKSAQPVADRILVARVLHTTPRDLLDRGALSLAQAVIIARAPGQDLQLSMTTAATRDYNPASATELSKQLTKGQFLVKTAKFNAEKSGLEIVSDLFGAFEPYFKDKGKALNAQIEWANTRAEKARAKDKHPFVAVESGSGDAYRVLENGRKYDYSYSGASATTGLIYYVNTDDGSVSEETAYRLKASAKKEAVKAGEAKADAPTRPISDAAYQEAHERRALALRESVVGNTHVTLALTVWGLLVNDSVGMVKHGEVHGLPRDLTGMPQLAAAVERLRDRIRPGTHAKGTAYNQHPLLNGNSVAERQPMLELLLSFTDQDLLECLNTLTALSAYDWAQYNNQAPLRAEYAYLASLTDAPQRLAANFTLTDEWLKRYPRESLLALAKEAGLELAPLEACKTQKDMRALIVEQAERLHREGFVPSLLRFPTPAKSAAQGVAHA